MHPPTASAGPLVAWFIFIWNVAAAGALEAGPGALPYLPVAILLPIIIALPLLIRSQRIAAAIDAAPASRLIGLQVYRVIGGNFHAVSSAGARGDRTVELANHRGNLGAH